MSPEVEDDEETNSTAFQKLSSLSSPNASAASESSEVWVHGASTVKSASPALGVAVVLSEDDDDASTEKMMTKTITRRSDEVKVTRSFISFVCLFLKKYF